MASKNNMILSDGDKNIMDQLPDETRNKLYRDFLYVDFCSLFLNKFFRIQIEGSLGSRFYSWEDPIYSNFMVDLL